MQIMIGTCDFFSIQSKAPYTFLEALTMTTQNSEAVDLGLDREFRVQPPYNVILLDDNDHTYDYVINMLRVLFGYSEEQAYMVTKEVDDAGRVIVWTGSKEAAELKRDQIHAWGRDRRMLRNKGSMSAKIEPAA
jgi:ATP-dependent Clp protease adaptor protein ClpS